MPRKDQKTSRGVIGVYDVTHHYQKVAEWSGFGIGPHEVILMADGRVVVGLVVSTLLAVSR